MIAPILDYIIAPFFFPLSDSFAPLPIPIQFFLFSLSDVPLSVLVDAISEYFGVKIAMYFAWLGHYTAALLVPAFVGFMFWVSVMFAKTFLKTVSC